MPALTDSELDALKASLARYGYELGPLISETGMGAVYAGKQRSLERHVAIKALKNSALTNSQALDRFMREMRIVANLHHPGIVPVFGSSLEDDPIPFFVMAFCPGSDLRTLIAKKRKEKESLSVEYIYRLLSQIASALDFVHSLGIVHRDVKPANVLLHSQYPVEKQAFLTDFGISLERGTDRVTPEGIITGTLDYLAPELCQPGEFRNGSAPTPTPASDRYSFALIVLEMLTGVNWSTTMTKESWMANRPTVPVLLPEYLSAEDAPQAVNISAVIRCALAKDPADRFRTATEFLDALRTSTAAVNPAWEIEHQKISIEPRVLGGESTHTTHSPRQHHRTAFALGTGLLVVILAGVSSGPVVSGVRHLKNSVASKSHSELLPISTGADSDIRDVNRVSDTEESPLRIPTSHGMVEATNLECNGQHVVILDTIVVPHATDPAQRLTPILEANPDAKVALPSDCLSMRRTVRGGEIYTVYIPVDSNFDDLCAAKEKYGGYGRSLNPHGDMRDPCPP